VKIFVTGATGFLGRNLIPLLQQAGHEVLGVGSSDCNLLHRESLEHFGEDYEQIWHLASWTQAGEFCLHHPGEQWIINQRINTNVVDWWRCRQPHAKLIAIGTSCSYAPVVELIEENYLAGDPVPELYSYAMTKRMLLVGMKAVAAQYNLAYLYLIPSTLFGPGYHSRSKQLHFIFDIMRKIVLAKFQGGRVSLWGDGHQKRELILVKDFAGAALRLAGTAVNEVVNVGSGEEFSIRWYAERICDFTGYDPGYIEYDTSRYTGVRSKKLNIAKLRSLLPDLQLTPILSGLEETLRWFQADLLAKASR
jgi:GDP-L-fucose synthase